MCFDLPANQHHLPVAMFCIALAMSRGVCPTRPQMSAGVPDLLPSLPQAVSVGYQALLRGLPQAVSKMSRSTAQTPGLCGKRRAGVRMSGMSELEVHS